MTTIKTSPNCFYQGPIKNHINPLADDGFVSHSDGNLDGIPACVEFLQKVLVMTTLTLPARISIDDTVSQLVDLGYRKPQVEGFDGDGTEVLDSPPHPLPEPVHQGSPTRRTGVPSDRSPSCWLSPVHGFHHCLRRSSRSPMPRGM